MMLGDERTQAQGIEYVVMYWTLYWNDKKKKIKEEEKTIKSQSVRCAYNKICMFTQVALPFLSSWNGILWDSCVHITDVT